jgi:hypothetical protein
MDTLERERADKAAKEKEKIGHRRVDRAGEVSYKRVRKRKRIMRAR